MRVGAADAGFIQLSIRMAKHRKTPELVAEAIRLRQTGLTLAKVAETIGVSPAAVFDWTREHFPKREPNKSKSEYSSVLAWGEISSHQSDSHNYPGHEERLAAHTNRIRKFLREHPEEQSGNALMAASKR